MRHIILRDTSIDEEEEDQQDEHHFDSSLNVVATLFSIELNKLIKDEIEIAHEYENKIEIKEKEYIEQFHQLDIYCQSYLNKMEMKIKELHADIELNLLNEEYIKKLNIILNKIEQLENEQIEQLKQESNYFEDDIKQLEFERQQLIDQIGQIDNDLNLAIQTI
ncbi:unnamed protein product [Rotaria sp. Silwood1]|nr:unnamed protein product [Rotaria sp. Silwood1]